MTDIRTTEDVRIGDHVVRVAEQETRDGYDAAVVKSKRSPFGQAFASLWSDDSEMQQIHDAPIVSSDRRYTAVGLAAECYLAQFDEKEDDNAET